MKYINSISRPFWRNTLIYIILLSGIGIVTGLIGFSKCGYIICECGEGFLDRLYTIFQMFILHHSFHESEVNGLLQFSRWIIFGVIILLSFDVLSILFREQWKFLKIKIFYCNHIVVCGLTEQSLLLAKKNPDEKKIFIDNTTDNPLHHSLHELKVKLIIGDPCSKTTLRLAKIHKAREVFIFTGSDEKNVSIAQSAFSILENKSKKDALRCFVSIADRELKIMLEETTLFKHKTPTFDGILFNVNEMGIKYGICMNIDKILPSKIETSPEILLVGLTAKAEIALLNLAHCLTMQQKTFRFTIVEKNEITVNSFRRKYWYLEDFATIEFVEEIESVCPEKSFNSILICTESQTEAIKQATSIRYLLGTNEPNILVLCDETDTFSEILNAEGKLNDKGEKEIFPLKDRNILLINLFEKIVDYVFSLNKSIEEEAKMAHEFWNKLYGENKEYDEMSGHFRQTNRNQVLDNYLRNYITFGKTFEEKKEEIEKTENLVVLPPKIKVILAMMEHRRWMIEKHENGWRIGERIKPDEFKRHDCLIMWDELPKSQKKKDCAAIDLMIHLLIIRKMKT